MLLQVLILTSMVGGCPGVAQSLLARYLGLNPRQAVAPPGTQQGVQQQYYPGLERGGNIQDAYYPGAGVAGYPGEQALIPGYGQQALIPGYGQQALIPGYGQQALIPGYGEQAFIPGYPDQQAHMPGEHGIYGDLAGLGVNQFDPYSMLYGMNQYGVNPYTHYDPYTAPNTGNEPPPLCRPNANKYIVDSVSRKEYKVIGFPDNDPNHKIELFSLCGRGETLLILRDRLELQSLIPILDCVVNNNAVAVLTGGFVDNTGTYTVCSPGPDCQSRIKKMPFENFMSPVIHDATLKYIYLTTRSGYQMEAIPHAPNSVYSLQQQGLPVGYICEKVRHPDVFDFGNNNPAAIFW